MKLKKIPSYILPTFLSLGASTTTGLLSYVGLSAVLVGVVGLPPLAAVVLPPIAFSLSFIYECEVYGKNINGAQKKLLFKNDDLKHFLVRKYLREQQLSTDKKGRPQFFDDFESQEESLKKLRLEKEFQLKKLRLDKESQLQELSLDKESQKRKKEIDKEFKKRKKEIDKEFRKRKKELKERIRVMVEWLIPLLFHSSINEEDLTLYAKETYDFLEVNARKEQQALLERRKKIFIGVKIFSVLAGTFMGLGTSYLLAGAFNLLPFLAAISLATLPGIIVPLSIIAGVAYAFLVYNALTDMINNDTLREWYRTIRNNLKELNLRSVLIVGSAIFGLILVITLTICTAGTWWAVVKNAHPLFCWMGKIPILMASSIAFIVGVSEFIFGLENTSDSLKMLHEITKIKMKGSVGATIKKYCSEKFNALTKNENWLQIINPFRLMLIVIFVPLRLILFFAHILAIAVTSDGLPDIPKVPLIVIGFLYEFFSDLHYFFGIEGGHDHSADLPTRLLKFLYVFNPVFVLAAAWDCLAKRIVKRPTLSLENASEELKQEPLTTEAVAQEVSNGWKIEEARLLQERSKKVTRHNPFSFFCKKNKERLSNHTYDAALAA